MTRPGRATLVALSAALAGSAAWAAGAWAAGRTEAPPGIGLDPGEPVLRNDIVVGQGDRPARAGAREGRSFQFKGFLRVPLRLGLGTGQDLDGFGGKNLKIHSPPQIPDSDYLDWQYTNNLGDPWTELMFSYGNASVAAHVTVASYKVADGGYSDFLTQLRITASFVSFTLPRLFGKWGGLVANVGVFSNRYGAAGQYGAGKYDTYLIGATRVAGESVRVFFDLAPGFTLHLEHGFGAKLELPPFSSLADRRDAPSAFRYAGEQQQGTTLLHHEHIGISYQDRLMLAGHFMMSWNTDSTRLGKGDPPERDGRIINLGVDVKLVDFFFGEGYIGYCHTMTRDLMRLGGALEFGHSREGWNILENYFAPLTYDAPTPAGNGAIDSWLFQYTFSLSRFLRHPEEFWGQDRDVRLSLYGMLNRVTCDDAACESNWDRARLKLKWGADAVYSPLSWLNVGARFDAVNPNMKDNTRSFHVASAMVVFRTAFLSHERILLQYSRYFRGKNVEPAWPYQTEPFGPNTSAGQTPLKPDDDVFQISATMWW